MTFVPSSSEFHPLQVPLLVKNAGGPREGHLSLSRLERESQRFDPVDPTPDTTHGTAIYAYPLTPSQPLQLIGSPMAVPWSVWELLVWEVTKMTDLIWSSMITCLERVERLPCRERASFAIGGQSDSFEDKDTWRANLILLNIFGMATKARIGRKN